MMTCSICHFAMELDDAVLVSATGHGVCLRCFDRETGRTRPMPKGLVRELEALLGALEAA